MVKHYDIESARGTAVELHRYDRANWSPFCNMTPTIEEARKDLADAILSRLDHEDRGEEFENEWRALADRAQAADVGDVLAFDEHGWRIVEVADDDGEEDVVYGVVDTSRSGTGDTWATVCASEDEARGKARDDWHRLTREERRRRTICAAVGRLDDDGEFYLGEYTPIEVHEDVDHA